MGGESPIEHNTRWPVVSLADITTKIGSGATPKGGADAYLRKRVRFALVRSQNVFDRRFDTAGLAFITDEQANGLRGVVLKTGDILLNITGDGVTFGRACLVPNDVLPACVNQHVSIVRVDPLRAHAGYVLAYLTHPSVKSYIESFNAGGSRRAITKGHIESFRIPLPSLPEQCAIARILGALDDKIELNHRMNETLEAMARALFKSWFVNFDPVRDKTEGRDSGSPRFIADLFPDSFEELELGPIPRGWRLSCLGDETVTLLGGTPSRTEPAYWGGGIPWINSGKANEFRIVEPSERITQAGLDASATKLLPARTTVIAITGATLGQVSLTEISTCTNQSIVGVLGSDTLVSEYIYCWVKENIHRLVASQTGGAQQHINKNNVNELPVLCPPRAVMDIFVKHVRPLFDRIRQSCFEARTLSDLRDALLPKLISGELKVGQAERISASAL